MYNFLEKMPNNKQEYHELEGHKELPPIGKGPTKKNLFTLKQKLSAMSPELKNISQAINAIRSINSDELERISNQNSASESIELLEQIMDKVDEITASTGQIKKLIKK